MIDQFEIKNRICQSEKEFRRLFVLHRTKLFKMSEEENFFPGQTPILVFVYQNEGCTQKEVASALKFKPASVTDALKRMERDNLIIRTQDEKDLRITRVRITEKGIKQMELAIMLSYKMKECCFKDFSEEEITIFISYIKRICDNLDDKKGEI